MCGYRSGKEVGVDMAIATAAGAGVAVGAGIAAMRVEQRRIRDVVSFIVMDFLGWRAVEVVCVACGVERGARLEI